ncbi:hypothetical protein AB0O42_31585 [Streptomyces sp. NPDC089922]|uniref:hypothetical protein n=1 Tax=Streptomyces sp. NPDC089922 TaxID=3155189 RepID=UPI003444EFAA
MANTEARGEGACRFVRRCRLRLSVRVVDRIADVLGCDLRVIWSRWRFLPAGRIAVIVSAVLGRGSACAARLLCALTDIEVERWRVVFSAGFRP